MARFSFDAKAGRDYGALWDGGGETLPLVLNETDAIELRDLLLQHFPLEPVEERGQRDDARFARNLVEWGARERKERRERIATAVLVGLVVGRGYIADKEGSTADAIAHADALIGVLDKEQP